MAQYPVLLRSHDFFGDAQGSSARLLGAPPPVASKGIHTSRSSLPIVTAPVQSRRNSIVSPRARSPLSAPLVTARAQSPLSTSLVTPRARASLTTTLVTPRARTPPSRPVVSCPCKPAKELGVPVPSLVSARSCSQLPTHSCKPAALAQPVSKPVARDIGAAKCDVDLATNNTPKLQSAKTTLLSRFCRDLTQAAANGTLDPLVGRVAQIERMTQILSRRQKNNPILIGEPGVGKTAVVEGLAQQIVAGDVPEVLMHKCIMQLDLAAVLAGASARGEFEKRLKDILQEVVDSERKIILFIDEIHSLVGTGRAGQGESAVDAANIMKPALARGDVQCIGVTSMDEYRRHIEKDKALERRFQPIIVPEASVDETVSILQGLSKRYEAHHKVKYSDAAIRACAMFSSQYIADRFLPDKAIDVLDESGSRVSLRCSRQQKATPRVPLSVEQLALHIEIAEVKAAKQAAARTEDFQRAAELKQLEEEFSSALQAVVTHDEEAAACTVDVEDASTAEGSSVVESESGQSTVTEDDIAQTVAEWTGVPVEKISADEAAQLVSLEATLHSRIIGQTQAVTAVAKAVRRSRAGLKNPDRPIASFMFCGPTGVGKTELCKVLASAYFGREDSMIRIDMSELMESHSVAKLIGSPAGYVGYGDENQLTDRIRRKPHSLVLLDEIEKAHPDVLNLLLQLLEDGRLTDSKGRVVSFRNALIIMTSNAGSAAIERTLANGAVEDKALANVVSAEVGKLFQPEFLNRLDEVVAFRSLTKIEVAEIAELEFTKVLTRVQEKCVSLSLTNAFKMKVIDEAFSDTYGARPLRRVIMRFLEDELAESLLQVPIVEGECIVMDVDANGQIAIQRSSTQDSKSDDFSNDEQSETTSLDGQVERETWSPEEAVDLSENASGPPKEGSQRLHNISHEGSRRLHESLSGSVR